MAVAGLHNLSAFSPFFGESQSRQWGEEPGTPTTRASPLLQMWRELEGDHVVVPSPRLRGQRSDSVSENVDESQSQVVTGLETNHDDSDSIVSEQSSDLGETERERVRQIFREWMNSGSVGHSSNGLVQNSSLGPQCIVNPEIGARRPIRRLCGRQMLLDLIQRAQCERREEIQGLLGQRPVSDFTHRNRIQAFLRGRFLRNEPVILSERPSSVAATELGLLRQRHTVSDLREGFLSKLENSASTSGNSADCDSLSGDLNNGNSESTHIGSEIPGISTTLDSGISDDGNRSQQEFVQEVTQEDAPVLPNVGNEQEMYLENNSQEMPSDVEGFWQEVPLDVRSARSTEMAEEMPLETEDLVQSGPHDMLLETEEINLFRPHESPVETDYITQRGSHGLPLHTDDINQSGPQVSVTATQERTWQEQTRVAPTESADGSEELIDRNWQEASANRLFLEASENNATEQDQMQESHEDWPSHDLQEAIDSWLYMPSGERRIDTYFSDDDNVHSMEIRELFSRRRVSSLLRSSFRVSLDRVLQSHMERQGHASDDWEVDNASSSPSQVEQDQGQQDGDRALHPSGAADRMAFAPNEFDPTSSFITPSDPLWDEMQGSSLPHNLLSHHFRTDWEVVNELRIDIARLQQRLNNMQNMLEQCMDMQIELQRSVRQEVSAALNRSILTRDASKGTTIYDESQWECVRSGVCILCRASSIDSLLYRCGHMCTCSKCADQLIQDTRKCPMCRAPVVEAVRAYFIQ